MKRDFENEFADFLEERLGAALSALRDKNAEYSNLSDKYADLLGGHYQSVGEYTRIIAEITVIGSRVSDMQKRYLFLAGMREQARIKEALFSDDFEELFAWLK